MLWEMASTFLCEVVTHISESSQKIPPAENPISGVFCRNLGILEKINTGKFSITIHDA